MNIVLGSRLIRDGYSFKSENNGCSVYMRDMFYGHAPLVNGLFLMNLERDVTHIHSVNTKDVRLITIVPHTCGTAALVTLVSRA